MTREEEAIKELEILKEDYWDDDGYGHETKQYDDTMFALDIAIDRMRKYQKIEQIVDRLTGNNAEEKAYNYMMIVKDIKKVLEDDSN